MRLITSQFTYSTAKRQFLGHADALKLSPPFPEELVLMSHKSGKAVTYRKSGEKKDEAGKVLGVGYVPTSDSLRKVKTCWGTRVVIVCEGQ